MAWDYYKASILSNLLEKHDSGASHKNSMAWECDQMSRYQNYQTSEIQNYQNIRIISLRISESSELKSMF
jgi:hypothetical protein